jgi:hypothetical protein
MSISSSATGLRPGVCTSTTRPTNPYTGQIIYETDTGYLRVWDGSAWDYFLPKQDGIPGSYTDYSSSQTFSGFTKGNATVFSKYTQVGKLVHFWGYVTLGSTSSMTGPLDVNLPVTSTGGVLTQNSPCSFYNGTTLYWGTTLHITTGALRLVLHNSSGTYASNTDITSTLPFTWATSPTNNSFFWNHLYEAA